MACNGDLTGWEVCDIARSPNGVAFQKSGPVTHVNLESENIDVLTFKCMGGKSVPGWADKDRKGRVVFTAVGHNNHALWNPQYLEIQKRSVRWLLQQI